MGLLLLYLFAALGFSFLCSVLEAVLLSTPMTFVSMLESEGRTGASLLKKYKQDIDKPISAILTLNTIAHTVGAAGVGAQSQEIWGDEFFALTSAVLTFLILVLSEIIPKTIGASYWRQLAIPAARIIHTLVIITYPFVLLSEFITHFFSSNHQPMTVSREEVSAMVNVGAEEGVLATKENRMIQNLLKLDDIKARDIMTPSSVVEMAEESMTLREFYRHDAYSTYSRIPVYNEENDDFIKGYVLRQTILEKLSEDKFELRLTDIVRPVLTFQENEPVSKIWEKLLAKKEHISVIIDEYGCFRGIVTMEDVIETMLGTEIVDEKDTVTDMQELAREKWQEQQEALQG
ncbi:MAG: hemolysin family protein [Prevotellamassilia sp.]|nr:hemolysin family protein [Bacteroidales bacterium]MEE1270284.1 hemolysin family protein [Prevotellamassilia sp.]MCI6069293.1 hemolysin family protein [Bacteroidales bacterium]MDD6501070.1 hemolysin family protein [Bacteroidales bacterium]MDD6539052.1 hemolysin family protein [Bacteroidales bacterium]